MTDLIKERDKLVVEQYRSNRKFQKAIDKLNNRIERASKITDHAKEVVSWNVPKSKHRKKQEAA